MKSTSSKQSPFSKQSRMTRLHLAVLATTFLAVMPISAVVAQGTKSISTQDAATDGAAGVRTRAANGQVVADPAAESVRTRFSERFGDLPVKGVQRTPYGLFEVQVGMDLVYTDENVTFVMQGPLIDVASRSNVTAERLERISAIDFSTLPKENAIKIVKGKGTRQIAVFEDPNCGYCKQFHKTLENVDDITVYSFLFPILSEDSHVKSRNVWCASNQTETWNNWMTGNKTPPTIAANAKCETPIEANLSLGESLGVRGTPAIFFEDGTRAAGALPIGPLNQRLDASSKAVGR